MSNYHKIIAILSLLLIAISLLIAHNSPAAGYELDIYKSTPIGVWICIILSFLGGAAIILHQIFTKSYKNSKFWITGLIILILARVTLLYIPYIRGYELWSGDHISYLGLTKDILLNGHFSSGNFYPITHLFLAQIVLITGIPDIIVVNLSTALISVIFVLSIYLLAGAINFSRGQQLLATVIAGSVMIAGGYNVILSPNGWSILLLPLLFYFYFMQGLMVYRILLVIFLVIYPFFHPLSALIVIISLAIIEITRRILLHSPRQRITNIAPSPKAFSIAAGLMVLVISLSWDLSFQQFEPGIRRIWFEISNGIGTGKMSDLMQSLNQVNVHGVDFYILLVKMYGMDIILILLSGIGIFLLLKRLRRSPAMQEKHGVFPLALVFAFVGLLYIAYLVGVPGTREIAEGQWDRRILSYLELLLPIFSIIVLFNLFRKEKFPKLAFVGIISLVTLVSGLSVVSLYPSPYVIQPNSQITHMDMSEMSWFINRKDINIDCTDIYYSVPRSADGILGVAASENRADQRAENIVPLKNHFGYDTNINLGDQYPEDRYAALTRIDKILYTSVWQNLDRFNQSDFNKLEQDSTVNKVYSNNEDAVYYISSSLKGK
jgi:hypothetical protein